MGISDAREKELKETLAVGSAAGISGPSVAPAMMQFEDFLITIERAHP